MKHLVNDKRNCITTERVSAELKISSNTTQGSKGATFSWPGRKWSGNCVGTICPTKFSYIPTRRVARPAEPGPELDAKYCLQRISPQ